MDTQGGGYHPLSFIDCSVFICEILTKSNYCIL